MIVRYSPPKEWIRYDVLTVASDLIDAKAAILALRSIPYQRSWAERFQQVQLKSEVAGTSRIEGAVFSERELDVAIQNETPQDLLTRSQKQARAAVQTYRWIAALPDGMPIDTELVKDVHRHIVTGCDDDHCPPGVLRSKDENVVFGTPPHRGAEGGAECRKAFDGLMAAAQSIYHGHDLLIQALAFHYHIGAMHPFLDGNGRTARAVEALFLQRAGLRDDMFIAMSNYYYDKKPEYLATLSEVAANNYDLTSFLSFGLKGVTSQCEQLRREIQREMSKSLFRDVMYNLFGRLKTKRKRVLAKRQIEILKVLLEVEQMELNELYETTEKFYRELKTPWTTYIRDLNNLLRLKAIAFEKISEDEFQLHARLEWPTEITETRLFEVMNSLPQAKTYKLFQEHELVDV